ncbi:MAG: citrate synthase [Erysipelotrichales bacterium]
MKYDKLICQYAKIIEDNVVIDDALYHDYNIKRGLRNADDTGVIVGMTKIGAVLGYKKIDGKKIPIEGRLFYRDIELKEIIEQIDNSRPHRFEQVMFLLLFSRLPNRVDLSIFKNKLNNEQKLPYEFSEDFILRKPSQDIMNQLQRNVLCLYSLDDNPDQITYENLTRQAISLIAKFPSLVSYSFSAYKHRYLNDSLVIHPPLDELSIAENILRMTRNDGYFSELEADVLDIMLVVHADHGGGNNSTFTTHVVSSTSTDTYSSVSASIGSLKGPRHGGANAKVKAMIDDIRKNVVMDDEEAIYEYIRKIIKKEVFDKQGLVYGMGHAIYTLSDPRAILLKEKAYELSCEKDMLKEYQFYESIEKMAQKAFKDIKGEEFIICANVDLYSGLVYEMLNISPMLYTPLFALSRVASWNAHRIEQIFSDKKIIRPAYVSIKNNGTIVK